MAIEAPTVQDVQGVSPEQTHVRRSHFLSSFRLWQMRAFFSMATLYLFYYFGKKNIGVAAGSLEEKLGLSHEQLGFALTAFTLTYALGQFINGFLGDRYSPRRIMLIGAIGGVVANILFGLSNALLLFVVFWAINGYFSSMGWAPGCRILCNWFPERRWGWWMGLYNFFPYLGGALVSPIAAYCIERWGGWQGAFFIPPLFLAVMAVFFALLCKDSPEKVGIATPWNHGSERSNEPVDAKAYWRVQPSSHDRAICGGLRRKCHSLGPSELDHSDPPDAPGRGGLRDGTDQGRLGRFFARFRRDVLCSGAWRGFRPSLPSPSVANNLPGNDRRRRCVVPPVTGGIPA